MQIIKLNKEGLLACTTWASNPSFKHNKLRGGLYFIKYLLVLFVLFISKTTSLQAQIIENLPIDSDFFQYGSYQEYKGDLYTSGAYSKDTDKGFGAIVKWNGKAFCKAGIAYSNFEAFIFGMTVYKDDLYIYGRFSSIDGVKANNIARYDGNTWHAVSEGIRDSGNTDSLLYDAFFNTKMIVYKSELFICGRFNKAGTIKVENIASWDGANWHDVGSGLPCSVNTGGVSQIIVYQNCLYATEMYDSTHDALMRWDGKVWDTISGNQIGSMAVYNGYLTVYAPHLYHDSIKRWDGNQWLSPLPTSTEVYPYYIYTCNGRLYAMGEGIGVYEESLGSWRAIVPANLYSTVGNSFFDPGTYNGQLYLRIYDSAFQFHWGRVLYPGDKTPDPTYKIYPNPSTGFFTIETISPNNAMDYELYNTAGQRLLTGKLSPNECCVQVSISGYPSGLYFIRIRDGNSWHIEKVEFFD